MFGLQFLLLLFPGYQKKERTIDFSPALRLQLRTGLVNTGGGSYATVADFDAVFLAELSRLILRTAEAGASNKRRTVRPGTRPKYPTLSSPASFAFHQVRRAGSSAGRQRDETELDRGGGAASGQDLFVGTASLG